MESAESVSQIPLFKRWFARSFLSSLAKQIKALVVGWQVYHLTHSPMALGLVGLSEAVPYVVVGLWAGHAADRYEKRWLVVLSQAGLCAAAGMLMLFSRSASPNVLPIYFWIGVAAVFMSFEAPSSSSYLQTIVPQALFSKAAAWNLTQFQAATIAGPIVGGFILERTSPVIAYGIVTALFAAATGVALLLKPLPVSPVSNDEPVLVSIRTGLRFLMSQKIIFACMTLDMLAVLFGDVVAILPVFAVMLGAGPLGLGVLRAAPAMGSCLTSIIEANRPFIRVEWKSLVKAVTVFGVAIIAFALSKDWRLSVCFLAIGGLADGVSVIVRQSIYQANTPDHLRGRVSAVSGIFIRLSNEFGGFESGLMAALLTPVPSVLFGGTVTLVVAFLMRMKYRHLNDAA